MVTNNSSARAMTRRFLVSASGLLVLSGCTKLLGQTSSSSHAGRQLQRSPDIGPLVFDISDGFSKLNALRKRHLLAPFRPDARLQEAAQRHADMMAAKGLYGHDIGPGTQFKRRIFAVGYRDSSGENLGVGYGSIDDALQGWLDSPGHRKNMLKSDYRLAGLAYAFNTSGKNPQYTHFWVLIMGKDDGWNGRFI